MNQANINSVIKGLQSLLHYKNTKYGNSALKPLNIFSKEGATNSILVRLDDKLARIKNNKELAKNDVSDIMGYLTLLCVDKGWDNFDEFRD